MKPDRPTERPGEVDNDLPFPDSDISPALQRTLKAKLDRGENDAIPRKDWDQIMRLASRSDEET